LQGKVPTTPTSASIVASFQTQEALKLIHNMEVEAGKGLMINGLTNDIYKTEYPVKELCMSHSTMEPIIELPQVTAVSTTLAQLLAIAQEKLGAETAIEFDGEVVTTMNCLDCGEVFPIFKKMARLYEDESVCPNCGGHRETNMTHRISGDEDFLDRTLAAMDIPPLAIIRARNGKERIYLELTGDKETFLQFQ
jgi:adenylyltransferase/sulfurtransferase